MITDLQNRYLALIDKTLPELAKNTHRHWPISEDHCFARVVLDNICQDVWYNKISAPAYQHMSQQQLNEAITLCENIQNGRVDLHLLNRRSLDWRKAENDKQGTFDF